ALIWSRARLTPWTCDRPYGSPLPVIENTAPNVMVLPDQFLPPDVVVVVDPPALVVVVVATRAPVVVVAGGLVVGVVGAVVVVVVGGTEVVVVGLFDRADGVVGLLEQEASSTAPRVSSTPPD